METPKQRILAFSDLHADEDALDGLRALAMREQYDAVVMAGDFTNRGPVSFAQDVLDLFGPKLYCVHGNMDSPAVVDLLRASPHYLHGRKMPFGEWNLVGIGGSNPTPFNTPSEMSESQFEQILKNTGVDERTILVSHPPPRGFFDRVGDLSVGSTAVRSIMESQRPLMVICGHIHEHEGQRIAGDTLVVKLPAAQSRRAASIVIGEDIDVRFFGF